MTAPYQSHSDTSRAAADAIAPSASTLREAVHQLIVSRKEHGATDQEVQEALDMTGNTERPRRRELEAAGLIKDSGRTRKTAAKREAVVWVATEYATIEAPTRLNARLTMTQLQGVLHELRTAEDNDDYLRALKDVERKVKHGLHHG